MIFRTRKLAEFGRDLLKSLTGDDSLTIVWAGFPDFVEKVRQADKAGYPTEVRLLCRLLDDMTGEQVLSCSDIAVPGGMTAFAMLLYRESQKDHPELGFAAGDDGQATDREGTQE